MLERFVSFLHRVHLAQMSNFIQKRYALSGELHGCRHPLENAMFDALSSTGSNVYVHWGVYESGKSNAARNTALKLQKSGLFAIYMHGFDFAWKPTMCEWLSHSIGLPGAVDHEWMGASGAESEIHITKLLNKPTSIIIDHFDDVMRRHNDTVEALQKLDTKVMLVVSSYENALELCNKGCKLIGTPGCGKWSGDELNELFSTLSKADQDKWTGVRKEELMRLSTFSGSPGYLSFAIQNGASKQRAEIYDKEWRNGIHALGSGVVEEAGKFPDKNGNFHWD